MPEIGEIENAPASSDSGGSSEPKTLEVVFGRHKLRCGDRVALSAITKNVPDGTAAKLEVKQKGAVEATRTGTISVNRMRKPWITKARTDEIPEPKSSLHGTAAGLKAEDARKLLLEKFAPVAKETKTFACSSGIYGWTGKFDIESTSGEIVITVKIKLVNREGPKPATSADPMPAVGAAVSAADKTTMKADIESRLSEKNFFHREKCQRKDGCDCPKKRSCCKTPVKLVVEFVESGEHHTVNLFQGSGRANATNWTRVKTRDNSYAHETGHLLGWYDEYAAGAVGAAPRWMSVRAGAVMNTGLTVPPEYYWDFRDWWDGHTHEKWKVLT